MSLCSVLFHPCSKLATKSCLSLWDISDHILIISSIATTHIFFFGRACHFSFCIQTCKAHIHYFHFVLVSFSAANSLLLLHILTSLTQLCLIQNVLIFAYKAWFNDSIHICSLIKSFTFVWWKSLTNTFILMNV